ncbi:hypothetical protein ACEWY4_022406 [Coilia grayii]|uniref:ribonuclease H n=1 Tax=Coilia grayii TaxID=363190 RepID=A0ABD1J5Y0_9TELE
MGRPEKARVLRQEIVGLLEKGAISPVGESEQQGGFYSKYFLVPKKDGGTRPILDLRSLNCHLKVLRFHMLRTVHHIQAGDWFTAIDLEDAYFHVPIAPHHRQFLRFAFEGRAYEFRVLPFGIALAPCVFTRCVAAALAPLQVQGLRILPYLDDWLICSRSEALACLDVATVLSHVADLGLRVNYRKSSLVPCQETNFLGIQGYKDTLLVTYIEATPSQARIRNIHQLLGRFRRGRSLTLKSFQRLLGMLTAASSLIPLGLLDLRPLQGWLNDLRLDPALHGHRLVKVTHTCHKLLRPWRRRTYFTRGVPLAAIPSRWEVVTTDASLEGWGRCGSAGRPGAAGVLRPGRQTRSGEDRQLHGGVLHQPPGGHQVPPVLASGPAAVAMGPSSSLQSSGCVFARRRQQGRGSAVSPGP